MNRYQFFNLLESNRSGAWSVTPSGAVNTGAMVKVPSRQLATQGGGHVKKILDGLGRGGGHVKKILAGLGLAGLAGAGIRHGLKKRSARIAGEKSAAAAAEASRVSKAAQAAKHASSFKGRAESGMKFLRKNKGKAALAAGAGLAGMMFMRKKKKD